METYEEFINNILEARGRFACGEEYHERHHIIPRCMGGTNDKENLIDLFAKEHFEAHRLLALENPDNDGLVNAWTMMAFVKDNNQKRYEITPEEYEEAKIALSKLASKRFKGDKNPWFGAHLSEETRRKMRENHSDVSGIKNPMYGKKHSEEVRTRMKMHHADFSGENSPLYGKNGKECHMSKIINQYSQDGKFIGLWYGSMEIHRELGIDASAVIKCCNHRLRYKSAGGFVWYYADDPTQPDPTKIIPNKMIKEE